jgi:outer membrane protein OmpA-like peptidoglycan-associated protein
MTLRHITRYLSLLGLILFAVLLATGCVIREPQALTDIAQAKDAIAAARQAGAAERYPEDFAALEKRYLETRGVFYACRDDEASRLARALIADANALATRRPMAAAPPPPPPAANRAPKAGVKCPAEAEVNTLVTFDAAGSSDADGDQLTYKWDFGDGTTQSFTFPNATHRYARAGNMTVRLTVEDGRGGSDSTTCTIAIVRKVVLSEKEQVLFDFDKADLKPAGQKIIAEVVQEMKDNPQLRAHLVGHADSVGSDQYNMGLSKRRAESVRNAMVRMGVPAANITTEWKGESQPVASNATREGRAQNRRVEITLRGANQ